MNLIGIDKTVIKGFIVTAVDMDKLRSKGNEENVICLRDSQHRFNYFQEDREDNFNYIKITDTNFFNSLKIDIKKVGENSFIQYSVLDLSIQQEGYNNLIPLNVDAYRQKVKAVFKYIEERYGIMIKGNNVKFENIEFNVTIELNNNFNEYIRALQVMMQVAPMTYKTRIVLFNHRANKLNHLEIANKSIKCKLYDKAEQLENVYELEINKNILRVEYTILTDAKMQNIFGHNELEKLTDAHIKQFIKTQFNKDFISRYNKFREGNRNRLLPIAKNFRKNNVHWIKPFLLYIINYELKNNYPLLMDIQDLKEIIKAVDKVNYFRNWKQVERNCPTAFKNIDEKVAEIFKKIEEID